MNILAFDTCFSACSAAIGLDVGLASERIVSRFERMDIGHAERLPGMIAETMAQAGISFSNLDRIGVTIGPGTFTGTRVGVAAARGFALACLKPVFGVTSLAVMARQAALSLTAGTTNEICVAVDVRRDEVYVQWFDPAGLLATSEPEVVTVPAAALIGQSKTAVYIGSGAEKILNAGLWKTARPLAFGPDLLPDAKYAVLLVSRCATYTSFVSPLYLRAPDAKPAASTLVLRR